MHFFETWRFPLVFLCLFPTRVVSFSDDHPSLKLENPNNKPRGFSSHRLVKLPRMERFPLAWHLPGEANYGRLYEWHQFLPTRCLNLRGVTLTVIGRNFPTRFDSFPKRNFRNIPMEGSQPPQKKRCVC